VLPVIIDRAESPFFVDIENKTVLLPFQAIIHEPPSKKALWRNISGVFHMAVRVKILRR